MEHGRTRLLKYLMQSSQRQYTQVRIFSLHQTAYAHQVMMSGAGLELVATRRQIGHRRPLVAVCRSRPRFANISVFR